ncbi:Glycosyl hydrolase family 38, C-terminal [Sesbania bispinosa]|nr:Glycosyl hydrolase family 38, C-terminal [Sesbania bispinosa]
MANTRNLAGAEKIECSPCSSFHDDVGWLKTVDQYYVGSNSTIQERALRMSSTRLLCPFRKIQIEKQSPETQEQVRKLVDAGQLEFVNGGWCMHDEATCHYIDMIDQTTLGHLFIKEQFNKTPRAGWQIDPFGHSAVQGYLLGAELGFDSVHFARIDYQDRAKRKGDKSLEVIWRASKTFGSSAQIFANAFPVHYSAPNGFNFEVSNDNNPIPVQDDPLLFDYNVEQRVNDLLMLLLPNTNMQNLGWESECPISTPSIYTNAKNAANQSWPLKTDDYFPYASAPNAYWTGFFTSRPGLKRYVRMLSGYYLATRQLEFFAGKKSVAYQTFGLGDALGIAQHHDAVTGTAKQHTTDDYAKRLAIGASKAEAVVISSLACLTSKQSGGQCSAPASAFSQCQLLNISYCPPTEDNIPAAKSLVVVVYNPLGWNRTDIVRIPVNDANLVVKDSSGNKLETQYVEVDDVSIPPLGWSTYFISEAVGKGKRRKADISDLSSQKGENIDIGPGNLKMSFSSTSGQLRRMYNSKTRVDIPIQQSYLWYGSSEGDNGDSQASGAYIFRPSGSSPNIVSRSVPFKVIRGPLVDEVHQKFSSWIYQVTRLYKDKDHAEIEFTLNLGIYTKDKKSEFSVLVDRAIGGASIEDGEVELMLHRRILHDDAKGVGEALDEQVCVKNNTCEGLTVRGNYYISIHNVGAGSHWRRTTGQEIYSPLILAFTHENSENWKSSHLTKGTVMDPNYSLPPNVALITLEELEGGIVLLRLAHLYEPSEDAEFSTLAKVELKKLFATKTIKELKEVNLSANQEKSEMKKMTWKVEGDRGQEPQAVRGGPVSTSNFVVELGPMEIRTFLLKF